MNTTSRKDWDPGTKKDTFTCVALLAIAIAIAIAILVFGAISVHHQNALQSQQLERTSQRA